jgi:hypothetical protein
MGIKGARNCNNQSFLERKDELVVEKEEEGRDVKRILLKFSRS